jgi:hypothetical protein
MKIISAAKRALKSLGEVADPLLENWAEPPSQWLRRGQAQSSLQGYRIAADLFDKLRAGFAAATSGSVRPAIKQSAFHRNALQFQ